jgi:hypothetical protein
MSSSSLFQPLVEADLVRLRSTTNRPSIPIGDACTSVEMLAGQKDHLEGHKDFLDEALRGLITKHGKPSWSDIDVDDKKRLQDAGFVGDRIILEHAGQKVGMRYAPAIDESRAFSAYGPRAGHWHLGEPTQTLRHLHEAGRLKAMGPGILEIDTTQPISGYSLMPATRKVDPTGAKVYDLTGAPGGVKGPVELDKLEAYLGYRADVGRRLKSLTDAMEPGRDAIKRHLIFSGVPDETVVSSLDVPNWRLYARPTLQVDPKRLVPIMGADIAKAVGTPDEERTRRAWKGLTYDLDAEWVREQKDWRAYVRPPAEASMAMLPIRAKKAT